MFHLGDEVKDKITGFRGIVIGKAEYLYGCKWIQVAPKAIKDFLPVNPKWMDELRFDLVVEKRAIKPKVKRERLPTFTGRGGPQDAPSSPRFPSGG